MPHDTKTLSEIVTSLAEEFAERAAVHDRDASFPTENFTRLREAGLLALAVPREFFAEAGPGDFIYVPAYVPHQEINASTEESLQCVLVRSDQELVVVNLNISVIEEPEEVFWVDSLHARPLKGERL